MLLLSCKGECFRSLLRYWMLLGLWMLEKTLGNRPLSETIASHCQQTQTHLDDGTTRASSFLCKVLWLDILGFHTAIIFFFFHCCNIRTKALQDEFLICDSSSDPDEIPFLLESQCGSMDCHLCLILTRYFRVSKII